MLPLAAGILLQWYALLPAWVSEITLGAGLVALLLVGWRRVSSRSAFGIILHLALMAGGMMLVVINHPQKLQDNFDKHYRPGVTLVATLQEPLVNKPNSLKALALVAILDSAGNLQPLPAKVIIYLEKATAPALWYGSKLVFNQPVQDIRNSGNPGSFNYRQYCMFNNIAGQVYLKGNAYQMVPTSRPKTLQAGLFQIRDYVLALFRRNIRQAVESGVAEALLLGYRDDLDKSLTEQYANTGVIHIIAISGMHLGMIYFLLMVLLAPLAKVRGGKYVQLFLILAAIWFFALLTGAAPSIARSAIMFSIVAFGMVIGRKGNILNSLAASAFILLLYDPFVLWNAGFQLSYAAVLSLALFSRTISQWWVPVNGLVRHVWNAVAATLAAQILTLPLVLYHFHQFPLMFLLANMVAVPLSVGVLYGLLLLVCIGWWQAAAAKLGTVLTWLIQFMNSCIGTIDGWWFAKIGNIHYTLAQAVVLALAISFAAGWLYKRGNGHLVAASLSLLALLGMRVAQKTETLQQHKLIVYNVPKHLAVDYVSGTTCLYLGDNNLAKPGFERNFHLQPSRIIHQVQPPEYRAFSNDSFQVLHAGGKTILFLNKPVDWLRSSSVMPDVLIVSHYIKTQPADFLALVKPRQIVLSANLWPSQLSRWKNAADSLHLRLHSVANEGAFVLPL